jgi:methionyl-tRNA formyltransferase
MTTARIIFAGTPEFSLPPLQSLIDSHHEVIAVLTQPDRPAGRGRKLTQSPVKELALNSGIEVLQPDSLKDADVQTALSSVQADLMVVVAYGLLLPQAVLNMPARGCINIHASLLPRWRGASPIQTAILAGDTETGISIMQMDAGLDTGAVLYKQGITIGAHETAGELHDRLAALGGELLATKLDAILAGELPAAAQVEAGASYAGRIAKRDGLIDWSLSAVEIDRQIRAYHPWPVAHTIYNGQVLRCLKADIAVAGAAVEHAPGLIVSHDKEALSVQTAEGLLCLTLVQLAGKKPVAARDFANANATDGVVLGGQPA